MAMHANLDVEGVVVGVVQRDLTCGRSTSHPRIVELLMETSMKAAKLQAGSRGSAGGVAINEGIAHVSFPGGSMFLPARNPHDRQLLLEYIADRVRAKERVQVIVDGMRWMVDQCRDPATAHCSVCGCILKSACCSSSENGEAECLGCAFAGDHLAWVQPKQEPERRLS